MMKQEFEERANFKVSPECYHTFIEPGYNASNLDKDEWVKEWKKNGGVQAAYDWECAKRIKAEKAAKGAEGEKTNMAKALIKKADQPIQRRRDEPHGDRHHRRKRLPGL